MYYFQSINQWPFQEPKLEVPTIYKAYVRPIFQAYVREYPHKIWPKKWYIYVPPFYPGDLSLIGYLTDDQ